MISDRPQQEVWQWKEKVSDEIVKYNNREMVEHFKQTENSLEKKYKLHLKVLQPLGRG